MHKYLRLDIMGQVHTLISLISSRLDKTFVSTLEQGRSLEDIKKALASGPILVN